MLRCIFHPRSPQFDKLRPSPQACLTRFNSSASTISTPNLPNSGSANHHDLPSFLDYANRIGLSRTSTTYVGTYYEYTVQATLRRLGFSLTRIGGRDDSGIDLLGTWHLPSNPYPLRVIVQCKALKGKLGPNLVRELEGALVGAPAGWRGEGVLGLLVSPRSATKGVREAVGRSRWGLGWVMVESGEGDGDGERELVGRVRQVLWNRTAARIGLEGITVTMKYGEKKSEDGHGGLDGECALLWKDKMIEGLPDVAIEKGDMV